LAEDNDTSFVISFASFVKLIAGKTADCSELSAQSGRHSFPRSMQIIGASSFPAFFMVHWNKENGQDTLSLHRHDACTTRLFHHLRIRASFVIRHLHSQKETAAIALTLTLSQRETRVR
jgi:hypothetical protein